MKNKKIILFVILGLGVIIVIALIFLFLYTYTISGKVTDVVDNEGVENVELNVASHSSKTNENGEFSIQGIKFFEKKNLQIKVPSEYEKIDPAEIEYKSRKITQNISLEPTIEEIAKRTNTAKKDEDYESLWDYYVHPDSKGNWDSREAFISVLTETERIYKTYGYETKSITVKDIETIESWACWMCPDTQKRYENTARVASIAIYLQNGKEQEPSIKYSFYHRIDGYYHWFYPTNQEDGEYWIQHYDKYKPESHR